MSDSQFGFGSIPFNQLPFVLSPILELDTKYVQDTDAIAGFAHVEWRFADAWRLTLGARYTSEERTWTGCTFSADDNSLGALWNVLFGTSITAGGCGTIDDDPDSPTNLGAMLVAGTPDLAFHIFTDTIKTDRWMGKVTLDYSVNDDVLLYGTISNGFKSGGFNGANSNSTRQLEPIRPEILTSYEIGVKSTLADGTLQLNAAAFFYDYEDKQEQEAAVTFVGNISGLGNVDESEITGAEIDLQWVPGDGWNINLGVAFLDSEITEWVTVDRNLSSWPDNIVPVDAAEIGAELPMAPNLQYSALVIKAWTVNERVIDAAVDYSWTDKTTGGVDPRDATDDYGLLNARIGYGSDDGRWRFLLWGRNITDEFHSCRRHAADLWCLARLQLRRLLESGYAEFGKVRRIFVCRTSLGGLPAICKRSCPG
jgi:iron complex outermembrane receptor protein